MANLVGIGGVASKVKEIIQKIRKPIDKAVGKAVGFMVGKAKGLIAKITGADKPREELPKNKEEHDIQVNAGLAAIDKEEQKYLENKEISRVNAEKVADTVKKAYPVFKSITVVDGGKTWDYDYVASPTGRKKGDLKAADFRTEVQRKRWKEYTGIDPKGEVHHGLPEEYHEWLKDHGVTDINSGEYYFDLPKDVHRLKLGNGIHTNDSPLGANWNNIWKQFIKQNPNASPEQINDKLNKMAKDAAIEKYRAIKK